MPPTAIALVLVAACLHASWNLLAKRARDPFAFLWLAMLVATILLAPLALMRDPVSVSTAIGPLVGSALVHGVYFVTLGEAYREGDLSTVYPIARGLGVALAPIGAALFFAEVPSAMAAGGIALVVIAIASMGRAAPGATRPSRRGVLLALATGPLIASYSVLDHHGVATADPIPFLALTTLGALTVSSPLAWRRREAIAREWRDRRAAVAFAAIASLGGYALVLFAFRLAPTAYVVAAREISIVIATLYGRFVLAERVPLARGLAAAGITAGVALVAIAH